MKKKDFNDSPIFVPRDRYFINRDGWWFYTVDMICGPFPTKPDCVDACRRHIQSKLFGLQDITE